MALQVRGQAQEVAKEERTHDVSKVLVLSDRNWIKMVMQGGENTHMLIFFESLDCLECRQYSKVLRQLANETKGKP